MSIAVGAVLFVLFAYATITGFDDNVSSIGRSSVPFLVVADHDLGGAAATAGLVVHRHPSAGSSEATSAPG